MKKEPCKKLNSFNKEQLKLFTELIQKNNRIKYPEQEKKYPWLSPILDAHYISDIGIEIALENKNIACHKGCSNCCKKESIPIIQTELQLLLFYITEILDKETKSLLLPNLKNHQTKIDCPFLLDDECSVYAVRPIVCRQFLSLGDKCNEDEVDIILKDTKTIFKQEIIWYSSIKIFESLGINSRKKQIDLFNNGYIFQNAKPIHEIDWEFLADNINYLQI